MENEKWEKCWKIKCTPALEVYQSHINFFGTNLDIEQIDGAIDHHERHAQYLKEAKEIWQREFGK